MYNNRKAEAYLVEEPAPSHSLYFGLDRKRIDSVILVQTVRAATLEQGTTTGQRTTSRKSADLPYDKPLEGDLS